VPLPRAFYARGAEEVAAGLLGKVLVGDVAGVRRRARIVETEAYVGTHDLASHSSKGRTARNESMWGPPGHAYVYFVYGMHWMLNVVCAEAGDPQAVLLRAAEPLDDWQANLAGPARLARAFGVTKSQDGADLCAGPLHIEDGEAPEQVARLPRIGVDYAGEWAKAPLRFVTQAGDRKGRARGA
jgi:DNA-3-methyladenine glycosylase